MTNATLKMATGLLSLASLLSHTSTALSQTSMDVKPQVFEVSASLGTLSIEDFPSELMGGISAAFVASEDFFVEYNYLTASISLSNFERNPGFLTYTLGEGRRFRHYDLLLGYNLFQSEFFTDNKTSLLSNLYLVAGVGDTKFGTEDNFTYTLGVGYRAKFTKKLFMKIDFRNHFYDSALVTGSESEFYTVTQFSGSVGFLF